MNRAAEAFSMRPQNPRNFDIDSQFGCEGRIGVNPVN
jgi:hypothetical protein